MYSNPTGYIWHNLSVYCMYSFYTNATSRSWASKQIEVNFKKKRSKRKYVYQKGRVINYKRNVAFFFFFFFHLSRNKKKCPHAVQFSIHYENLLMQYIFLIFAQNIDCGYTLEPPRRGGSNEYPQSMFWSKNKKNRYTPATPSFTI